MKHTVIYIDGMTCINCQSRIWNVLKLRPEITGITVSYEYSRAEFDYDPKKIRMKEIVKMIEDLGYQVIPAEQFRRKQLRQAAAEIFAIALLFVILQRFGILNHLAPDSLAETGMGYGMLFVIGLITSYTALPCAAGSIFLRPCRSKKRTQRKYQGQCFGIHFPIIWDGLFPIP